MKYKYAVYCSGGAKRILDFFAKTQEGSFFLDYVFYDGGREKIMNALKNTIDCECFFYKIDDTLTHKEINNNLSETLHKELKNKEIDYLFCFGNRILSKEIVSDYKNQIINFHPSLLPAFPGIKAIDKALASGVKIIGNTAHFIDEGVDTGPIIMQTAISVKNYSTYDDVLDLQTRMLSKIWFYLENDKITIIKNKVHIEDALSNNTIFGI